jgi:inner membrane protein
VTHGLLGACLGQALYGRKLGRRALVVGAVGQMLPDIDGVLTVGSPVAEFVWHRSFTHALWFGPVVGPVLAWAIWRRTGRTAGTLSSWIALVVLGMLTHPVLDLCTTYGTQLLHPFSTRRFTLDAVAIVDPAYTLLLVAGLVMGWRWGWASRESRIAGALSLALSTGYLFYGYSLNESLKAKVREDLGREGISSARVEAYPTLLQLFLRRVVVRAGSEVRVGFVSQWTQKGSYESFHEPQDALIATARATPEGRIFEWFATGQTVGRVRPSEGQRDGGSVVEIDDLRFGFPERPRQGLWGLRFRFDTAGRLLPPVERFNRPLPAPATTLLGEVWNRAFGIAAP